MRANLDLDGPYRSGSIHVDFVVAVVGNVAVVHDWDRSCSWYRCSDSRCLVVDDLGHSADHRTVVGLWLGESSRIRADSCRPSSSRKLTMRGDVPRCRSGEDERLFAVLTVMLCFWRQVVGPLRCLSPTGAGWRESRRQVTVLESRLLSQPL
jgi:hypothetical protein